MRLYRFSRHMQAWGTLGATCATVGAIPVLGFGYALLGGEGMGDMRPLGFGAALLMSGAVVYAIRSLAAFASWSRAVNEDQSLWEKIDSTQRHAGANDVLAMSGKVREHSGRKQRAA